MTENKWKIISLCLFSFMSICGVAHAGQLIYSTYVGGDSDDFCYRIAIDNYGNAYITGYTTSSTTFPITTGAFDTTFNGGYKDIYVAKLNATGTDLIYATFIGGNDFDEANSIAVDNFGNAYITGYTYSPDFPVTTNAVDTSFSLNTIPYNHSDIFITKLNPTGTALGYSTFLGGANDDIGTGIVLDDEGNAYITGASNSVDFPTTAGAYDTSLNSSSYSSAIVTKINTTGSALVYSTFLGGSNSQTGAGIAVDTAGKVYLAGYTQSTDFPTTTGAYDTSFNGNTDIFITKFNAAGTGLEYSTYLGSSNSESVNDIAIDYAGNAYLIGETNSTNFPTTVGAIDVTANGYDDIYITKLNATGSGLSYSTYLGGTGNDRGKGIAVDLSGNAYIVGYTESTNFPVTAGAMDTTKHGLYSFDGFVSKLNPAGTNLLYSTFFGGSGNDWAFGIAVDPVGNAYIAGYTDSSTDFPVTAGAYDITFNGVYDIFISKLMMRPTAIDPSVWQQYDLLVK